MNRTIETLRAEALRARYGIALGWLNDAERIFPVDEQRAMWCLLKWQEALTLGD